MSCTCRMEVRQQYGFRQVPITHIGLTLPLAKDPIYQPEQVQCGHRRPRLTIMTGRFCYKDSRSMRNQSRDAIRSAREVLKRKAVLGTSSEQPVGWAFCGRDWREPWDWTCDRSRTRPDRGHDCISSVAIRQRWA